MNLPLRACLAIVLITACTAMVADASVVFRPKNGKLIIPGEEQTSANAQQAKGAAITKGRLRPTARWLNVTRTMHLPQALLIAKRNYRSRSAMILKRPTRTAQSSRITHDSNASTKPSRHNSESAKNT